jgi:hypothetical protein
MFESPDREHLHWNAPYEDRPHIPFEEYLTIRKARIVEGQYYDSVKMGILREEWEDRHKSS